MTPFQRILGAAFNDLPAPVRVLHALTTSVHTAGLADIRAAANPGVWLLCKVAGLPKPGQGVPVSVSFHPDGRGREFWNRRFAGRRYASTMEAGRRRDDGLLIERFGPFDLLFRLEPTQDKLAWSLVGWRVLGVPLPAWSRPIIECSESGDGTRFLFDIDVAFPLVGHVVHYRGWLDVIDQVHAGGRVHGTMARSVHGNP
ncbi:DUF4166 domain-containing protein [Azospirillum canadense]|uniref:DUF4166 domain-containing protein n=1 Tax=Azospirillum canadense TaxID=403962 RepID=UPI002225CD8C|nr:DUF4166 domain-containing protein [Azospirillum canadense]MCW2237666.1 hypothetical protein [Azospirillum canadense]